MKLTPIEAYDRWAATYDAQPDNVVFALESALFSDLLARIAIRGKTVVDIGCGTGRHWQEILSMAPAELIGVDPSPRMLEQLKAHYPAAQVLCAQGDRLDGMTDASCDVVVSTLALAHIANATRAIREWTRVLRQGSALLLTDFHPAAIRAGMKRTFVVSGETIDIEHYATDLDRLREIALQCGLTPVLTAERVIDEAVRPFYERARYLKAYDRNKGLPLVFGMQFLKSS